MRRLFPRQLIIVLIALLPIALVLAMMVGPELIPPSDFLSWDTSVQSQHIISNQLIVEKIRFPRALLAAIIGATLAVTGVMMQGLFRNPLADPSLIGVTSGATAGAGFVIVIGMGAGMGTGIGNTLTNEISMVALVAVGAFIGAMISTLLVYKLASGATGTSVATMLLAGIAIGALAGALNSFFQFIADSHMLRQISLWQMGSLSNASWPRLCLAYIGLGSVLLYAPRYSRVLNALLLGESEARHLGIDVSRMKLHIIVLVALAVGLAVSLTGAISFVGLITPHIVRLLIGPDHRFLIPCSALAGAVLLILADTVSRFILAPSELPIGVVTAMLGAPFFLSLLRQQRNAMQGQ